MDILFNSLTVRINMICSIIKMQLKVNPLSTNQPTHRAGRVDHNSQYSLAFFHFFCFCFISRALNVLMSNNESDVINIFC